MIYYIRLRKIRRYYREAVKRRIDKSMELPDKYREVVLYYYQDLM